MAVNRFVVRQGFCETFQYLCRFCWSVCPGKVGADTFPNISGEEYVVIRKSRAYYFVTKLIYLCILPYPLIPLSDVAYRSDFVVYDSYNTRKRLILAIFSRKDIVRYKKYIRLLFACNNVYLLAVGRLAAPDKLCICFFN